MSMLMQSGMINIMELNDLSDANYADAIGIASLAYSEAAGVPIHKNAPMPTGLGESDDGTFYADWGDRRINVPKPIYESLLLLNSDE